MASGILQKATKFQKTKMRYTSKVPEKDAMIMVCTDASWANAEDGYGQRGYIMLMGSKDMRTGTREECGPIAWKFFKLKRRTQSTLAAEAMALERGLAEMIWSRVMWRELTKEGQLNGRDLEEEAQHVMATAVVDNKPIYDYIKSHGFSRTGMECREGVAGGC